MTAFISGKMGIGITPEIPAFESYNVLAIPFKDGLFRDIYLTWNSNIEYPPSVYNFINYIKKLILDDFIIS